jgi:hypothetical protein
MMINIIALAYLVLMFINLVIPTGLSSPRGGLFNLDWVTLMVIAVLGLVGLVVYMISPFRQKK